MDIKLNNSVYDWLKWLAMIVIPAVASLYAGLDATFGWGYSETVSTVANYVIVFIGAIIGVSDKNKTIPNANK